MSYHVIYLWKCFIYFWKECVFCFFQMKGSIYISVKSIWSRALFNAAISLLIFCLEYLSIFDTEVLKSPTISVLLSISFFEVLQDFPYIFGCSYFGWIYVYNVYVFLMSSFLEYFEVSFNVFLWLLFWSLFCLSIASPAFSPVHLLGIFFSNPSLSVCVGLLFVGGSHVGSICVDHVFLSIQLPYVFWLEHLIHSH